MCFSTRPKWEEDVEFTRPARRVKVRYSAPPIRHQITETQIIRRSSPPSPPLAPIIKTVTPPPPAPPPPPPPPAPPAPSPPPAPPAPRIELVSVEEERRSNPRTSVSSIAGASKRGKSRHGSGSGGGGEVEEEIVRERIRERINVPQPRREELETYRYVEAPQRRSVGYETQRGGRERVVERERVRIEEGRRR